MDKKNIEKLVKALGLKEDFDTEAEIDYIKIQAQAAARNTTFKWVV